MTGDTTALLLGLYGAGAAPEEEISKENQKHNP